MITVKNKLTNRDRIKNLAHSLNGALPKHAYTLDLQNIAYNLEIVTNVGKKYRIINFEGTYSNEKTFELHDYQIDKVLKYKTYNQIKQIIGE